MGLYGSQNWDCDEILLEDYRLWVLYGWQICFLCDFFLAFTVCWCSNTPVIIKAFVSHYLEGFCHSASDATVLCICLWHQPSSVTINNFEGPCWWSLGFWSRRDKNILCQTSAAPPAWRLQQSPRDVTTVSPKPQMKKKNHLIHF